MQRTLHFAHNDGDLTVQKWRLFTNYDPITVTSSCDSLRNDATTDYLDCPMKRAVKRLLIECTCDSWDTSLGEKFWLGKSHISLHNFRKKNICVL